MNLANVKLGPKLIGGFCVVAVIGMAIGLLGISNLNKVDRADKLMYNSITLPLADLQVISEAFPDIRVNLRDMLQPANRASINEYISNIAADRELMTKSVDNLDKRLASEELKKLNDEFTASRKEFGRCIDEMIALVKEGKYEEGTRVLRGDAAKAVKDENDAIDKMVSAATAEAQKISETNDRIVSSARIMMTVAIIIGFLLAVGLGLVITLSITRPLSESVALLKELSMGHLNRRLKMSRKDEVGELCSTMDAFADDLLDNVVRTMQRISEGDVSMEVKAKDDKDEIIPAMKKMIDSLRGLISETKHLSSAAVAGDLSKRGDTTKFKGGYREILQGFNETLEALIGPLTMAAAYIDRISKGDLPEKITTQYNGDFNILKNNLNICIDSIKALIRDANTLAGAAVDGQMDVRVDAAKHQGDYRKIIEGMNNTFDSLVGPLKRSIEHIEHLGNGVVDERITRDYKGDYVRLKVSFNKCFDAINLLISDTNMLVGSALNGQLSVRADGTKHQGDFRKIIEGVNSTMDAVVKPIQEASLVLDRMANNDLTSGMTGDYKGDLALIKNNINKVLDTLNESLMKVSEAVTQVASASQQLSSTAEEMSAGAEEQTNQTSQVATSMEEMSATVQEVAKNSGLAAQKAQDSGATAHKGGEVVSQTVSGMNKIADSVRDLQQVIEELSKNSEKIGDIVSVIDDVADQTNLLALNAAIEAARAGEQGRGFAVVADEVRKLAERTTTSTKEIATMVKTIQDETAKAASSMEHSSREVENGMQYASSAGTSLKEIVEGTNTVQEMVKQIATAAEQQSAAAEEISSNIESIASVSKQNAQGAQQTSSAAQELSGLTDELQSLVSRFKLKGGSSTASVSTKKTGKIAAKPDVRPSLGA